MGHARASASSRPSAGVSTEVVGSHLPVRPEWACSTAVRLTATGSPDPSVDGGGAGHGQLVQAGYPVSWGSRAVWALALRFRSSTSKIAFCRRSSLNPDRPYKSAAPCRGTQDQAAYCLGRSHPQTKAPHLTNDLIRAPADRACHTSSAGNHPTRVTHVHYCMVERHARAHARELMAAWVRM